MRQYLNWKTYLIIIAVFIVGASLSYTNTLATKLANEERKNIKQFIDVIKIQAISNDPVVFQYARLVLQQNRTIPLILTDEKDNIIDQNNLDSIKVAKDTSYVRKKLEEFRQLHPPVEFSYISGKQRVYYGESYLLMQLRYYPYVQLTIIIIFLLIVVFAITSAQRSLQNQVWAGLSKETAHQLGTPLSSMEGWLQILHDADGDNEAVAEMQKDLDRLKLIADRFSKVGSAPQLVEENLVSRMVNMVDYMQKRAPSKVKIAVHTDTEEILVNMSGPLFDWVLENLIRNALDAMDGKGNIDIRLTDQKQQVIIDVSDTGKGIPKYQVKKIFAPGFTTKKRGWGLGLSLAKRIVEQFHHGSLFVKQTEVGKGTTFRIILRR
ncbi:MAG: histidine kinase [Bacteroidetes bacterium 43-93]|nr:HAMP domain-containing histidine kinase [Bacteroidota bacterium]OJX01251.1 MAG: histidine kinase [Bacteroidetes bacterium 43-93]